MILLYKRLDDCFIWTPFMPQKLSKLNPHVRTIFPNVCYWQMLCVFCPLENESDVLLSLKLFATDVGVLEALVTDGTKAETSAEVKRLFINLGATLKILQ